MKIAIHDYIVEIDFEADRKAFDIRDKFRIGFWFEDQTYDRCGWVRDPQQDDVLDGDKVAAIYKAGNSFVIGMPKREKADTKTCKAIKKAVKAALKGRKHYLSTLWDDPYLYQYANCEPSHWEGEDVEEESE